MSTSSESTEMGELPPTDPTVTPSPAVGNATATGSRRSSLQQAGVQAQASDPPSSAGASSHQSGAPATLSSGSSRDTRNLASGMLQGSLASLSSSHTPPLITVPSAEVQNLSLNPSTSGSNVHQPEAPARQPDNAPSTSSAPKRARVEISVLGLQPHPAYSPKFQSTPDNYQNAFSHLHPWGVHVQPRPDLPPLSEETVTGLLPLHVYRHIPRNGYFGGSFVRSLFPRRFVGSPSTTNPLPIMEIPRLPDIIAFRQRAQQLIDDLLEHRYVDDSSTIARLPPTPPGTPPTRLLPPVIGDGVRPVLYQVVNRYYGSGVILEAKDFFIPGPDHRELHCLPLTQDSVNFLSQTRGFDRTQVSVKDFVWVLSLRPTAQALQHNDPTQALRRARIPRPSAMDVSNPFFFRVHEFILATPTPSQRNILGIVLAVRRRGNSVNHIYAAFEGCADSLRLTPTLCSFPLGEVEREDLLLADARTNVSCAMRFSHAAISVDAQRVLTTAIRRFLPAYPSEAIIPLRVSRLQPQDRAWIDDRLTDFHNYIRDPAEARERMGQIFSVASAALASQAFIMDDKRTHSVTAFVPSMRAFPIRLEIRLEAMASDGGWARARPVDLWVINSSTMCRARITDVRYNFDDMSLDAELHADPRSHPVLLAAISKFGLINTERNTAEVRICTRLTRAETGTDPVFELLASENLFPHRDTPLPSLTRTILDSLYAGRPRDMRNIRPPPPSNIVISLDSQRIQLRDDQARAVTMGMERHPVLAIQAAFGTGKTVVGALLAARLAAPGRLVIATATTNVAVAQFTDTLLKLDDFRHLSILRFVADTSLQEGAPVTPVDLHTVLHGLEARYSDSLTPQEHRRLRRYTRARRLIETMLFHPEQTVNLSEEDREKYRIAEMMNSETTERAIAILLRLQFPSILCITTSSLLNSTRRGGLFYDAFWHCRTIIADEASQIPEPVFLAIVTRFRSARHICIGDVHQLQPHLRCPRTTLAARMAGRGTMDLLLSKEIPLAPLVTTFRAHPALNQLPNMLVYEGALVYGTPAHARSLLTRRLLLPNPRVPFVFVDVRGTSRTSHTRSHFNDDEAQCCEDIILGLFSRDIPAAAIGVITFYKEQFSRLREFTNKHGVALHTVDSVQGREMDVAIVLTTRTDVDAATGDFLNDIKRINVAITRCKHGQFVLGSVQALRTLHHWNLILQWAQSHDVVIEPTALPDIFA